MNSLFESWALSSEWLHLLHMRKTLTGGLQSSVRGEKFFLSAQGNTDPLQELKETYSLMFERGEEKAREIQCRFLARRDFFVRHSKMDLKSSLITCQFSEDWLRKLNTEKISLVFATGYMNSAPSSFGHTFLKLQNPENEGGKELLDYGINYAARTAETGGAQYALYGLLGYFPGSFAMTPYHQMIKEYTHLEGRDLWEYELNFTQQEVQRILWHLLELDNAYFDYYFLDDNCSFAILKALEVGRPGLALTGEDELFVIPLDTVKSIQSLVSNVRYRPSMETEWRAQKKVLNSDEKQQIQNVLEISQWSDRMLEAGQLYYSVKQAENYEKYKKINYDISRERSKRKGTIPQEVQIPTPAKPETSHDSSGISLGLIDSDDRNSLIGFHFAFHDELSPNSGLSPFTHLEVLGFEAQTSRDNSFLLKRYRILETLSTEAVDSFSWPLSWGVSAGGGLQIDSQTRLQNHVLGKFGYSYDFLPQKIRWSNFFETGTQQNLAGQFQLVFGFETRMWIEWLPTLRSLIKYEALKFPSESSSSVSFDQAFDLTRNLELRGGWRAGKWGRSEVIEKTVLIQKNFLL